VGLCGAKAHEYDGNSRGEGSILRFGRRTKRGVSMILGVLIGLGLVILPGVLAPSIQTSTTSGSNSRVTSSAQSTQPGTLGNQPTGASATTAFGSLLILLSLVLFPAIALSFLARAWTLKRAKAGVENRPVQDERLGS